MATVGEMVEARANALGTGICIPAPGDVGVVPATVPPSMAEDILRSLGIWDAEVLEGTAVFDLRPDGGAPLVQVVNDDATWDILVRDGQSVRVIVLKEEE